MSQLSWKLLPGTKACDSRSPMQRFFDRRFGWTKSSASLSCIVKGWYDAISQVLKARDTARMTMEVELAKMFVPLRSNDSKAVKVQNYFALYWKPLAHVVIGVERVVSARSEQFGAAASRQM